LSGRRGGQKGVIQQKLAENTGMSTVAIAYIETGKRQGNLGTLNKFANNLKVNVADLFKGV
jgi:transcriptional regulator with XRE-family HTH domain